MNIVNGIETVYQKRHSYTTSGQLFAARCGIVICVCCEKYSFTAFFVPTAKEWRIIYGTDL